MDLPPISGLPMSLTKSNSQPAANDLRAAADGFESIFLAELLKGGRASLPGDDLTSSQAVRMAQDMLDTHLSQHAAGHSNLGVADAILRQFGAPQDSQ